MNYILSNNKTIAILHETEVGDRIVWCDERVLFLRKNFTYFWDKSDIIAIIKRSKKGVSSVSNVRRIDYHVEILNIMLGFERDQKIEDILSKDENKDTLWLAC